MAYYLSAWSSTVTPIVYSSMRTQTRREIEELGIKIKGRQLGNIIGDLRTRNEHDLVQRLKKFIVRWNETAFQGENPGWESWPDGRYYQELQRRTGITPDQARG